LYHKLDSKKRAFQQHHFLFWVQRNFSKEHLVLIQEKHGEKLFSQSTHLLLLRQTKTLEQRRQQH
jgi:hypothetical protein